MLTLREQLINEIQRDFTKDDYLELLFYDDILNVENNYKLLDKDEYETIIFILSNFDEKLTNVNAKSSTIVGWEIKRRDTEDEKDI